MSNAVGNLSQSPITGDSIVSRLEEIPTLPAIVYELTKILNDPMASTSEIEKIMVNDQSLTAKVLRMVNSAYFAIPGGVSSLGRAISYLGFETINQLVLCTSVIQTVDCKGKEGFNLTEFWKHSVGVAVGAETIAKFIKHKAPPDLFTCGLTHDLGKVALFGLAPEVVVDIVSICNKTNQSYFDVEHEKHLPDHTLVGQLLAKQWRLPAIIQSVIRHHHTKDMDKRGELDAETHRHIDIVYLANILVHAMKYGDAGHDRILGAPKDVLERLGIKPETDFKNLLLETKISLGRASEFMRILGGEN